MKKTPIYITGHQHPDTDSVASAIAYAFFKRSLGTPAVPCCLGKLNVETRYLLSRFHFHEPQLLTDARITVGEVAMDPPTSITPDTTIFECLQQMQQGNRTYCGVVDEPNRLIGMVTKSDISVIGLYDTARSIAIMAQTPLENIRKTLDGKVIYDDGAMALNGKVSVVAMTEASRLKHYEVEHRIVICGSDPEAQKQVIRQGAGLLVVVWADGIREDVVEEAKRQHCPIVISGHGAMNTTRYIYFAPSAKAIMKRELVRFTNTELAEDVSRKVLQSRYHVYPVTDADGHLTGYVSRYHIMQAPSKKLILVDHNEFSQSVRAIEKAQVLEVIDHHRINDFSSQYPVQFRNEIVGSTCTIVATIFRENQIPIPVDLAGLMLGAILSDTLNFHSHHNGKGPHHRQHSGGDRGPGCGGICLGDVYRHRLQGRFQPIGADQDGHENLRGLRLQAVHFSSDSGLSGGSAPGGRGYPDSSGQVCGKEGPGSVRAGLYQHSGQRLRALLRRQPHRLGQGGLPGRP